MKTAIVAGAGIVGVSTAIWLQRFGYQVKLIDRSGPASGTSYGNAGILASGSIIPVTTPGLISKSPGMLMNPNKPLFLKYAYLPRLIPFLFKYLRYANIEHVENYATAMSQLLYDTVDQHKALARGTGAERYIENNDYLFGYDTEEAFEKDRFAWDLRRKHQHDFDILKGDALHNVDPIYDGSFKVIVVNRNHGKINDPGEYIKKLAEHFVDNKGEIIQANIKGFQQKDAVITGLETDRGVYRADHVIFTLGPWSGDLSKRLGLNIPFESERGYHIELINPSRMPRNPIMVSSGKFVVTPMDGRIRLAGVVEFGGLKAKASKAPIELLKKNAKKLFADIKYDNITEWLGHRPTTASSLPLIGRVNKFKNVLVGFGHQHVGLTGGAKTGRIIAELLDEREPNIQLSWFDPNGYV